MNVPTRKPANLFDAVARVNSKAPAHINAATALFAHNARISGGITTRRPSLDI